MTRICLNNAPVNYHSALSLWTFSSKKDIQLSSFLIFLQNRDGSFFPLVSLKARHRHHYNRRVSSFRGVLWPGLESLWYKAVKPQQQFHLLWYLFSISFLTVSSCEGMMTSVLHIFIPGQSALAFQKNLQCYCRGEFLFVCLFCLKSVWSLSVFPHTSFSISIYTRFTLQNQLSK